MIIGNRSRQFKPTTTSWFARGFILISKRIIFVYENAGCQLNRQVHLQLQSRRRAMNCASARVPNTSCRRLHARRAAISVREVFQIIRNRITNEQRCSCAATVFWPVCTEFCMTIGLSLWPDLTLKILRCSLLSRCVLEYLHTCSKI